jgi:hypothetical protein
MTSWIIRVCSTTGPVRVICGAMHAAVGVKTVAAAKSHWWAPENKQLLVVPTAMMAFMVHGCVSPGVAAQRLTIVVSTCVISNVRIVKVRAAVIGRDRVDSRQDVSLESLIAVAAALKIAQHAITDSCRALLARVMNLPWPSQLNCLGQHEKGEDQIVQSSQHIGQSLAVLGLTAEVCCSGKAALDHPAIR